MLSLFVSKVGMEETQLAVALRPLLVMIYCCGFDLSEHQSYKSIQQSTDSRTLMCSIQLMQFFAYPLT